MAVKTYSYKENKRLSEHFCSNEFASMDMKKLYSDKILIDSQLIEILEKLFDRFDIKSIIINSGYRTPSHDISVGGNGKGMHTLGKAADFKCKKKDGSFVDSKQILCFLEDMGVYGLGRINSRSVHLDTRTKEKKWFGDEEKNTTCSSWYEYFGIRTNIFCKIPNKKTVSLTDALKSVGEDGSYSNRKRLASLNGISCYSGKAEENKYLLSLLMEGKLKKSDLK